MTSPPLLLQPHEVGARVILRPVEPQPVDGLYMHGHECGGGQAWHSTDERSQYCPYGQPGDVVTVLYPDGPDREMCEDKCTIASVRVARLGDLTEQDFQRCVDKEQWPYKPTQGRMDNDYTAELHVRHFWLYGPHAETCPWPDGVVWVVELEA